jgi:hypothetical protein
MTRASGTRAKSNGDAFETYLDRYIFAPLKAAGVLAWYEHNSPQMRPVKIGGRCYFLPVAASGGDWVLCTAAGSYCVVESKSTTKDRFGYNEIPPQQVAHLNAVRAAGGRAYLALQMSGKRYLIPWGSVPWVRLRTAYTVSTDGIGAWELRMWTDAKRIVTATLS